MAAPKEIPEKSTDPLTSLKDWYDMINGTTTTSSGGTSIQTETSGISQDSMNEMLKSVLSSTQGLQAVASGQRTAGGYGSTTNQMLINDLMTRSASQVAQNNKTSTITKTITPETKTVGGMTTPGAVKSATTLAGLQALNSTGAIKDIASLLKKGFDAFGSTSADTSSGGGGTVYTNPANESGNPNYYSTASSNMVGETGPNVLADQSISAPTFDATAGNPNYYSDSPANVDFSSGADMFSGQDWSSSNMSDIGIDPSSMLSSPAMTEDPLAFLEDFGFADGGLNTTKKSNPLSTSQFSTPFAKAESGGYTGVNAQAASPSQGVVVNKDYAAPAPTGAPSLGDLGSQIAESGSGDMGGSLGSSGSGNSVDFDRGMLGTLGQVSRIGGALAGSKDLSTFGTLAGIAGAKNPVSAAIGTGLNIATGGLAAPIMSLAKDPSLSNVLDIAAAVSNPLIGVANSILGLTENNTIGVAAQNAINSLSVNGPTRVSEAFNPITQAVQVQQADFASAQEAASATGDSPTSDIEASVANDMPGDPMDNLMTITNAFGTADSGGGGDWGSYSGGGDYSGYSTGDTYSSGDSGVSSDSGDSGGDGLADGAFVNAPGDGTVDTTLRPLAHGEYVLPADVVAAIGVDKLDALKSKFHVPVAVQRLQRFARG